MKTLIIALCALVAVDALAKSFELKNDQVTVAVDDEKGEYQLTRNDSHQAWAGSVGSNLKHVMQGEGRDQQQPDRIPTEGGVRVLRHLYKRWRVGRGRRTGGGR